MNKNVDYNLLIQSERIRYRSDYSGSHWLNIVLINYERGIKLPKVREAYETVLRIAVNYGIREAIEKSLEYPSILGFPTYVELQPNDNWENIKKFVNDNGDFHNRNRFGYILNGD